MAIRLANWSIPAIVPQLKVELDCHASTKSFYRLYDCEGNELRLPDEAIIDIVNRCHGKPVTGILRDGRIYYEATFGYGGNVSITSGIGGGP